MAYSVGNSSPANYANTSSGKVTNVVADNGVGGSGESVNVVNRVDLSFVISVNTPNAVVDVTSITGYIAGKSDITVTVNSGVYVYGVYPYVAYPTNTNTPVPSFAGLEIIGGSSGDTIKLVNNGYITGYGGDGAGLDQYTTYGCCCAGGYYATVLLPTQGGPALSFVTPGINLVIQNNGYIAAGGGGGAAGINDYSDYPSFSLGGALGGGGAGGGITYSNPLSFSYNRARATPTAPTGLDGIQIVLGFGCTNVIFYEGGGGGLVFPGVGGAITTNGYDRKVGVGGGAGGSGALINGSGVGITPENYGGSGNANAGTTGFAAYGNEYISGGGGGWGSAGGTGYVNGSSYQVGAVGGNSIITNGNAYTMLGDGGTRLWGSVNTTARTTVYTITTSSYTGTSVNLGTVPGNASNNDFVVIVPANVILASGDYTIAGLTLNVSGIIVNSVRLIVNGYILGGGGNGGSIANNRVGGDAISTNIGGCPIIIDNKIGYVAGGGGGGGRGQNLATSPTIYTWGGGGAGFGSGSGYVSDQNYTVGVYTPNTVGNNGTVVTVGAITYASAGSAGTILPGTRKYNTGTFTGINPGLGGSAGGSGAFYSTASVTDPNNYGGEFANPGGTNISTLVLASGGGGGGWGASGGAGRRATSTVQVSKSGGRAVLLNGIGVSIYVTNPTNLAGTI